MSNVFWFNWLRFIAILHVVGGIALSLDFPSFVWQAYRTDLYQVLDIQQGVGKDIKIVSEMLIRLFGATVASWGAMMWMMINVFESQQSESKNFNKLRVRFLTAILIWFVLDSAISLSYGVRLHVLINSAALISIVIPLYLLKPDLDKP
ncbi:MAG: hypothetical protein KUG78_09375 [Kangiellaceae bacterium]|nr:hypothetical protein [Kangiellaceae bacterium]